MKCWNFVFKPLVISQTWKTQFYSVYYWNQIQIKSLYYENEETTTSENVEITTSENVDNYVWKCRDNYVWKCRDNNGHTCWHNFWHCKDNNRYNWKGHIILYKFKYGYNVVVRSVVVSSIVVVSTVVTKNMYGALWEVLIKLNRRKSCTLTTMVETTSLGTTLITI
jgi:hypothetical protein